MKIQSLFWIISGILAIAAGIYIFKRLNAGPWLIVSFEAPSLKGNSLKENAERKLSIYLPPGYNKSVSRYPCLYFLHGFMGNHIPDASVKLHQLFDDAIRNGIIQPFIAVFPNSATKFGGSFYTNSSSSGKWADYIAYDVVNYMDSHFRTIPKKESRGICGHSMGGYGTIKISMTHPGVFGAAYALSPGIMDWAAELVPEHPSFRIISDAKSMDEVKNDAFAMGFLALGSIFSPLPNHPPFDCKIPVWYENGIMKTDSQVMRIWEEQFPNRMISRYRESFIELNALAIDWGTEDERLHIPYNCRDLVSKLREENIPVRAEAYKGGHSDKLGGKNGRFYAHMLPFFAKHLEFTFTSEQDLND